MSLDAELLKGIVRIVADDSRGTGFLVQRGTDAIDILTAFHVVGDLDASRAAPARATGAPVLRSDTVTVRFHSGEEITVPLRGPNGALTATHDLDEDWIVLHHGGKPPAGTVALPLAVLAAPGNDAAWSTFGYSDAAPDTGEVHSGDIPLVEPRMLHLFGKQAAAGKGGRVSGISGSPCIVDGQVVGLVQDAAQQGSLRESVHGAIYALPIQLIADRCGLPCEGAEPLPFQGEIEQALSALRGTFLGDVATSLGILSTLKDEPQRRAVARALLRADATTARKVLKRCKPYLQGMDVATIIDILSTQEIREETAALVERSRASGAPRGVGTVAELPRTAWLLALRAMHREGSPVVVEYYAYVDCPSRTPEDWADRIRSALCGMLRISENDPLLEEGPESIARELAAAGVRVVAVPFDPQALSELEKYPAVRPLVLVHPGTKLERAGYESAPAYRSKSEKDVDKVYHSQMSWLRS